MAAFRHCLSIATWRRSVCCSLNYPVFLAAKMSTTATTETTSPTKLSSAELWRSIIALGKLPDVTDLGQGYPDMPGDRVARERAAKIILEEVETDYSLSQYAPATGRQELREALSRFYAKQYGAKYDANTEVCVTTSGTEALYTACQSLLKPGDEVIVFEPYFPWYVPHVQQAQAIPKIVRLQAPEFLLNREDIESVVSEKTKMLILNTPHNPTGRVFTFDELEMVADICRRHNLIALSDEVYELVVFGSNKHLRLADMEGMRERTLTLGSASKMFSLTGWRVGWWSGPASYLAEIAKKHAYCSYCAPTPLQCAIAGALDALTPAKVADVADMFGQNAKDLRVALEAMGMTVFPVQGGYFLVADVSSTGMDATTFCHWLAKTKKVACVPMSVFFADPTDSQVANLVRFAICKQPSTIKAACEKLLAQQPAPAE
eukprot:m.83075 g.83075  ORF g.83075 m.83075 type:complete len:433 (+) comp14330_c0_seq5:227-1525(+)